MDSSPPEDTAAAAPPSGQQPEPEPELEVLAPGAEDAVQQVHGVFLTESAQKKDSDGKTYVMYGARVHVGYASGKEGEWWIFRRYSEWLALYDTLLRIRGGGPICPKPPPKNVLRNLDRNAVNRRLVELNKWLAEVTSNPRFSESPVFIDWLHEGRVADGVKDSVSPADLQITMPTFKMEMEEGGTNAAFVYTLSMKSSMVPSWSVQKRFSHFERLWELLAERHPTIAMPMIPRKSVVVTTTTANHRRKVLEKALHAVYRVIELAVDEVLLDFLDVPPLIRATANGAPPTRQGELQVLGAGSIDTRWFVLRGSGLSYAREQFAQWEASLDLTTALICAHPAPEASSSSSAQVISIDLSDGDRKRTLVLRATSDENLSSWLTVLCRASGKDVGAAAAQDNGTSLMLEPETESDGNLPGRSASFVSTRLSRGLSAVLDSPLGGRESGTPRGCVGGVVQRLETLLREHAANLPDLELTIAFQDKQSNEYVLIAKHNTEYAIVKVRAPGADLQDAHNISEHGIVVLSAHAFHNSMRFSQPDRQSVSIVYKQDSGSSAATPAHSTTFRLHTDEHAAIFLHVLQETHGIVSKQGLMAGLSGYNWVECLFTGPEDLSENICLVSTDGPTSMEGEESLISFWAPEGGWVVPPVAQANVRDAGRVSRSGETTLEDAVCSARSVKLMTAVSSPEVHGVGKSSALTVRTSDFGKKSVTYFDVGLCVEVHGSDASWSVARRFSHFEDLRMALRAWPSVIALPFPAKATKAGAVIGTDPKVVAARQVGLSEWLEGVLDLTRSDVAERNERSGSDSTSVSHSLACSPELLVFLGMSRAAQKQQELRRRASPTTAATSRGRMQRLSTKMLDSTDRTGRSIEVLIQSQEDASSTSSSVPSSVTAVCEEQLAECAAFQCVLPKLLFDLKTAGARLPNTKRKHRQLWLASDVLELHVEGATGADAVETIPYGEIQETSADAVPSDSGAATIELDDMQAEVPLDSPDWTPSNAATAEQLGQATMPERDDLRPRREIKLQYSGSGPRTPRIAGEIADRKLLAEHIAKKTMQRAASAAAAVASEQSHSRHVRRAAAERKQRLAAHLQDMTGLTEAERIRDVALSTIEGERAADAIAFAGLHKFVKRFADTLPEPGRIKELREMMTLVQRELLEHRRAQLLPLLVQLDEEINENDDQPAETGRLSLTQIVNQTIEEYVMDAISDMIWKCVCASQTTDEAAAIELNRAALRQKPQAYFGIEPSNFSPSAWAEAVGVLNAMQQAVLPTDKLRTLLQAKDAVLATFSSEHPPEVRDDGKMAKARTLAGDDFQPIFIYMVCVCDIPDLTPTCQLLWDLCDPKELVGEGGYYLTQFESAVYFICNWQPEPEEHYPGAASSAASESRDASYSQGEMLDEEMPPMPAVSISEDDPAVAELEREIMALLQEKQQAEMSAGVALSEGGRRKARSKAKKLEATIGELREIMADSARLDAYLSAKQHADASVVGSSVPNLSELPTKLSALSDILEEAGATDDDVEEMLDADDPRKSTRLILERLRSERAVTATPARDVGGIGVAEEGVPLIAMEANRQVEDSDSDECL